MQSYSSVGVMLRLAGSSSRPVVNAPGSIIAYLKTLRTYLTVRQAAKILGGRHPETIYIWIAKKGLPAEKHGHSWRIDPLHLGDWLNAQGSAPVSSLSRPAAALAERAARNVREAPSQ